MTENSPCNRPSVTRVLADYIADGLSQHGRSCSERYPVASLSFGKDITRLIRFSCLTAGLLLVLVFLPDTSTAQYHHGFGARMGSVSGLTAKYWFDNRTALDASLSYRIDSYGTLDASYLYHYRGYIDEFVFFPYIGAGAFTGKSVGDSQLLVRRYKSWYAGLLVKAGFSIPVSRIDFAAEAGGWSTMAPDIWGEWVFEIIVRYWL